MDSAYDFTKKKIRSVLLANIKKITFLLLIVCYLIKNCFNLVFLRRFQCIGEFLSGRQNNKTNPALIHLTSDDLYSAASKAHALTEERWNGGRNQTRS